MGDARQENESRNTIEKRQIGYATTGVSAALLLKKERIDAQNIDVLSMVCRTRHYAKPYSWTLG
jgi:hypothetical protein